jgi:hypothetical protein
MQLLLGLELATLGQYKQATAGHLVTLVPSLVPCLFAAMSAKTAFKNKSPMHACPVLTLTLRHCSILVFLFSKVVVNIFARECYCQASCSTSRGHHMANHSLCYQFPFIFWISFHFSRYHFYFKPCSYHDNLFLSLSLGNTGPISRVPKLLRGFLKLW